MIEALRCPLCKAILSGDKPQVCAYCRAALHYKDEKEPIWVAEAAKPIELCTVEDDPFGSALDYAITEVKKNNAKAYNDLFGGKVYD